MMRCAGLTMNTPLLPDMFLRTAAPLPLQCHRIHSLPLPSHPPNTPWDLITHPTLLTCTTTNLPQALLSSNSSLPITCISRTTTTEEEQEVTPLMCTRPTLPQVRPTRNTTTLTTASTCSHSSIPIFTVLALDPPPVPLPDREFKVLHL